jgi:hypothetical protein
MTRTFAIPVNVGGTVTVRLGEIGDGCGSEIVRAGAVVPALAVPLSVNVSLETGSVIASFPVTSTGRLYNVRAVPGSPARPIQFLNVPPASILLLEVQS